MLARANSCKYPACSASRDGFRLVFRERALCLCGKRLQHLHAFLSPTEKKPTFVLYLVSDDGDTEKWALLLAQK